MKQGAAPATINRELATLSHFLNRCLEWEWSKKRPKTCKCEEQPKKIVVLADSEKSALIQAALEDHDPSAWLFTTIAIGSGMRHSEIVRVRWEDIEFDQKRLYIGKAKAGQRSQPLPPSLTESLKAEWKKLGSPKGYIFPSKCSTAKHPHRTSMTLPFRLCVERAGLEPKRVTPHILRHTAITKLVQAGVDLPTIQRFSGHKTINMVLRYTQLSDEHLDRSVAKLDDGLSAALSPKLHTARTHATSIAA